MKSWRNWIAWRRAPDRMPENADPKALPPYSGLLRLRLIITVTIALLPIAVASMMQGVDRARHDRADIRAQLSATARETATPEQNVLASGEQIARALANLPDVRGATEKCDQDLSDALRGLSFFRNISRIDANGIMVCSADPRGRGTSVTDRAIWKGIAQHDDFLVSGETVGRITRRPFIQGMLPLHDAKGRFQGAIGISVDLRWLDYMVQASPLPADSVVAIFDRSGKFIAFNNRDVATAIFAQALNRLHAAGSLHSATDKNGDKWNYSIAALLGDNVFVGFAMPQVGPFSPTYIHVLADFVLPVLMIVITWLAIWFVTDRQLTRWIIYLRRVAAAYRAGHYALRPVLDDAPSEFRVLGDALAEMAELDPGPGPLAARSRGAKDDAGPGNPSSGEKQPASRDEPAQPAGRAAGRPRRQAGVAAGARAYRCAGACASRSFRDRQPAVHGHQIADRAIGGTDQRRICR